MKSTQYEAACLETRHCKSTVIYMYMSAFKHTGVKYGHKQTGYTASTRHIEMFLTHLTVSHIFFARLMAVQCGRSEGAEVMPSLLLRCTTVN